jgi:hypothetical protein
MKSFLALSSWLLGATSASCTTLSESSCKCFPGDSCWPLTSTWTALNETVGGRLIATVPLGSPCHDPDYDADTCEYLQEQWQYEEVQ